MEPEKAVAEQREGGKHRPDGPLCGSRSVVLSGEAGGSAWGSGRRCSSAQGCWDQHEGVSQVRVSGAKRGEEVLRDSGHRGHTLTSDFVSLFAEEEGGDLVQPGISFPGPAEEDLGRAPGPAPAHTAVVTGSWARPLPSCNCDPFCRHV